MRQVEPLRQAFHLPRLARGLVAQAMVHRHGEKTRAVSESAAPARHQPHQRDGIGPTGHRENDRRRGLEVREKFFRVLNGDRGVFVVSHGAAGLSVSQRTSALCNRARRRFT